MVTPRMKIPGKPYYAQEVKTWRTYLGTATRTYIHGKVYRQNNDELIGSYGRLKSGRYWCNPIDGECSETFETASEAQEALIWSSRLNGKKVVA